MQKPQKTRSIVFLYIYLFNFCTEKEKEKERISRKYGFTIDLRMRLHFSMNACYFSIVKTTFFDVQASLHNASTSKHLLCNMMCNSPCSDPMFCIYSNIRKKEKNERERERKI